MRRARLYFCIILSLLMTFLLCSCGQTAENRTDIVSEISAVTADSDAAEKARAILQAELDEEVKAGRLLSYEGLWTVPLMAKKGDTLQAVAGYIAAFGNRNGASGVTTPVRCVLTLNREQDGTYSEIKDKREYEVLSDGTFDNFSWIIDHPYVAQVPKSDVYNKGRDEIALMLFCQWMDTLKDWNTSDRTFVVTEYDLPQADFWLSTDTDSWGEKEGKTGPRPRYPDCLGSWIYNCQCRYQYLGYSSNISLGTCWSGKGVGVTPFWVEDFAPGSTSKHFILTEWQERYTLETRKHFFDDLT